SSIWPATPETGVPLGMVDSDAAMAFEGLSGKAGMSGRYQVSGEVRCCRAGTVGPGGGLCTRVKGDDEVGARAYTQRRSALGAAEGIAGAGAKVKAPFVQPCVHDEQPVPDLRDRAAGSGESVRHPGVCAAEFGQVRDQFTRRSRRPVRAEHAARPSELAQG